VPTPSLASSATGPDLAAQVDDGELSADAGVEPRHESMQHRHKRDCRGQREESKNCSRKCIGGSRSRLGLHLRTHDRLLLAPRALGQCDTKTAQWILSSRETATCPLVQRLIRNRQGQGFNGGFIFLRPSIAAPCAPPPCDKPARPMSHKGAGPKRAGGRPIVAVFRVTMARLARRGEPLQPDGSQGQRNSVEPLRAAAPREDRVRLGAGRACDWRVTAHHPKPPKPHPHRMDEQVIASQ